MMLATIPPALDSPEVWIISSMPLAAFGPVRLVIWPEIWFLAASSPNTIPAMAMAMRRSGAKEKTV